MQVKSNDQNDPQIRFSKPNPNLAKASPGEPTRSSRKLFIRGFGGKLTATGNHAGQITAPPNHAVQHNRLPRSNAISHAADPKTPKLETMRRGYHPARPSPCLLFSPPRLRDSESVRLPSTLFMAFCPAPLRCPDLLIQFSSTCQHVRQYQAFER